MSDDDKHDTIKLVDPKQDERSLRERFATKPRNARHEALALKFRDAVEVLEGEELARYLELTDLSRQDIEGMRRFLARDTVHRADLNNEADSHLKAMVPKRIWSAE